VWAKKTQHLPVVFTKTEVEKVLMFLSGINWLTASLLYGSGLRLMECLRLRVKDIDCDYHQITVRDAKGQKDRTTMLPACLDKPLQQQLKKAKYIHDMDCKQGFGRVYLPYALERKYANANREWPWQFVFPASKRYFDPVDKTERRYHIHESALQKGIKEAIRKAGISKSGSCHTLRHYAEFKIMPSNISKRGGLLAMRTI
jgi:integrase